jgi:hypothetical protein
MGQCSRSLKMCVQFMLQGPCVLAPLGRTTPCAARKSALDKINPRLCWEIGRRSNLIAVWGQYLIRWVRLMISTTCNPGSMGLASGMGRVGWMLRRQNACRKLCADAWWVIRTCILFLSVLDCKKYKATDVVSWPDPWFVFHVHDFACDPGKTNNREHQVVPLWVPGYDKVPPDTG